MMEKGADPDKGTAAATPLCVAAGNATAGSADCVKALLDKGAQVDKATGKHAQTALVVALKSRHWYVK